MQKKFVHPYWQIMKPRGKLRKAARYDTAGENLLLSMSPC